MAKKAAANTDELVKEALLKIADSDAPLRLSGKGEHPAVFASAAGPKKEAIAKLQDATGPLVVEVGTGKAATAKLTAAGFARIADALPEEKIGTVAKTVAESLPAEEQLAFLQEFLPKMPGTAAALEPLLAEAVRRHEAETAAKVEAERKRAERLAASQAALQRCMDHLAKLHTGRVSELTAMLMAAGGSAPKPGELPKPVPVTSGGSQHRKLPEPATAEDRDFRQDVAERLVSSWRDAVQLKKDEAQRFLETALDNISGLRRIGEDGEQVPFDGAVHQSIPGVFTDTPVKITRSGWALEQGDGPEYVIEKAQVTR